MNILQIYQRYFLPENLQMHMLRVAVCSKLIIENWNGPEIDESAIIRVCLLHDMGNIVKIPEDFSGDKTCTDPQKIGQNFKPPSRNIICTLQATFF